MEGWHLSSRRVLAAIVLLSALSGCGSLRPGAQSEAPLSATAVRSDAAGEPRPASPAAAAGDGVTDPATVHFADLWDRIRAGFELPALDSPEVAVYENWYAGRPAYFDRVLRRARLYLFHIVEETHRRGLPTEIALLPMVESAFEPRARSRSGAVGLWQFIPTTGRGYGLGQNRWYDERRDVISATRAALDYLEFLHGEFDGDWFLALAAYNAGENRVRKAMNFNRRRGRSTHYTALQLRSETKRYVPKLIAIRNIIAAPDEYAIRLAPIANEPFFARLELDGPLDLTLAAKLGGISLKTMHALNPAPNNGITPPDGPQHLLVPAGSALRMQTALRALPREQRVRWLQHTVAAGEYLGRIARRYDVSVADIKRVNRLRSDLLRVGQHLVIPVRADPAGTPRDAHLHLVRHGDTLWAISRRYGVYVSQLAQWNGISTADVLRVGQQIVVRGE